MARLRAACRPLHAAKRAVAQDGGGEEADRVHYAEAVRVARAPLGCDASWRHTRVSVQRQPADLVAGNECHHDRPHDSSLMDWMHGTRQFVRQRQRRPQQRHTCPRIRELEEFELPYTVPRRRQVDTEEDRPDETLFDPRELRTGGADFWTERRQAVSARQVAYTFLSYGLITQSSDDHVSFEERGPGSGYYARDAAQKHILRVVAGNTAADLEREIDDMLIFVTRSHNPLVHSPKLLAEGEFAADFRKLLASRFAGETMLPQLVSEAIRASVAGFPGS